MELMKKFAEVLDWLMRAHFVVILLISLGAGTVVKAVLTLFTGIPALWITPLWLFSAAAIMIVLSLLWRRFHLTLQNAQGPATTSSALAINGRDFSIQGFLAKAYRSDLQAEMESRISVWVNDISAKDRNVVFTEFVASGLIAYFHDTTWWAIFKSQILALEHLNKEILRREQVKFYYDRAIEQFPSEYANYSFQQWFGYLLSRILIIENPGETVAITVRGKDFLKHMVHYGYSLNSRRL